MKRILLAIAFVAAILVPASLISAAGAARADTPSDARYIADSDWAGYVTLHKAYLTSRTVAFTVVIQATRGEIPVNPLYLVAKANDGTTYDDVVYDDDATTLHASDLAAGDKVKGTVTLKVNGPDPTTLIYEAPLGETLAKWSITWHKVKPKPAPAPLFGSS
ncbi:DUF1942 domain-containing protein [Gordonia sp. DT30]|uniref:DUF1942 domain-containing protein n=1 Tax=Gordonia sp. DT30 TaxID=3416546 RepID=UPI003CEA0F21